MIKDNPGINPWEALKTLEESEEFLEGREKANELLRRCDDNRVNHGWYEFYDSAGFCLAISRREENRQKGRDKLRAAIEGRGPDGTDSTPDSIKERLRNSYKKSLGL